LRCVVVAALVVLSMAGSRAAQAQQRWVEDEAVLAPGSVRLSAGGGLLLVTYPGAEKERITIYGGGWNLEAAAGVGRSVELGARLGLRDAEGRAVHADEAARVMDSETFGTGLGTVANPEVRSRWRVLRRGFVEAGIEDRVVFPVPSYPDVSEMLGAWASLHGGRVLRADLALNGVLVWRSFAAGRALQPGLGLPVRASVNITSGLFASIAGTTHYLASTSYTAAHVTVAAGAGLGYRYHACDLSAAYQWFDVFSDDVVNGATARTGLGLALTCRVGLAGS
jgi:hypothetical protein